MHTKLNIHLAFKRPNSPFLHCITWQIFLLFNRVVSHVSQRFMYITTYTYTLKTPLSACCRGGFSYTCTVFYLSLRRVRLQGLKTGLELHQREVIVCHGHLLVQVLSRDSTDQTHTLHVPLIIYTDVIIYHRQFKSSTSKAVRSNTDPERSLRQP